jgi:hypothetical protein
MHCSSNEKFFEYFEREALNYYRSNSHAYNVKEDDMGGEIRTAEGWGEKDKDKYPYIEVDFGFRKLKDNTTCIAMFMPSFAKKIPHNHLHKWLSCHIKCPSFAKDDPSFQRWVNRYIEGSWEVEDGPMVQIKTLISLISSLTQNSLGVSFFKYSDNQSLHYPIAENSEEYTKANVELYRLIIDGMQNDAIIKLSQILKIDLTDKSKRLNSLKELLTESQIQTIHAPLKKLCDRRKLIHGLPSTGITEFKAFDEFNKDLHQIFFCLQNLLSWFETIFNIDAQSCKERDEAMKYFPIIVSPPRPEFKLDDLKKIIGKTIASIEFGEVKENKDVHQSEAIILHFTDKSSMAISIGSNAYNIHTQYDNISPNDFHTDIMIKWANSIKHINEKEA